MASAMGISERTFHALERGSERIKPIHRNAAWAAALAIADERRMPSLLPEELFLLMGRLVDEFRRVTHR